MIWGDYHLEKNNEITLELRNIVTLHMARVEQEVWLAFERKGSVFDDPPTDTDPVLKADNDVNLNEGGKNAALDTMEFAQQPVNLDIEGIAWSRWALKSPKPVITLAPMFPDLSFVVRPEYPFRLAPGAEAKIYTRIPLSIGIFDKSDGMLKLTEINTVEMVKSWFGTFENGEVCYWLTTTASQVVRHKMFRDNRCYCPIVIKNDSEDFLQIEKLCLQVARLSIYELNGKLWSDEMRIIHYGGDKYSDLIVGGKPPTQASGAVLIGKPRNPIKRGIAERTFKMLNLSSIL